MVARRRRQGNSQVELFPRSRRPTIPIDENHRLVVLTDSIDWTELEIRAEAIRASKLKSAAGRPPHLRVLLGALVLRATRYVPLRVLAEQIRHYAPARYLCGLTETEWTPDHRTLHDFFKLMGEEGVRLANEYVVELAVEEDLANPTVLVADTTAQEAAIPYPSEMGLMAAFIASVGAASKRAGTTLKEFARKVAGKVKAAQKKVREYRLFAKTKKQKGKVMLEMTDIVDAVQRALGKAIETTKKRTSRVSGYGKVARAKVGELHTTMGKLLPQIRHWVKTGRVASGKIISLYIPELYSIVRGKVGKTVEFGLTWGFRRLRGGFVLATVATSKAELHDTRFAVSAVDEHIELFGEAPEEYGYDRGGWSEENVSKLKRKGVKKVGLAPRGSADWTVDEATKKRLVRERAQIEGCIGTAKHSKYGFNRPAARSAEMMGACGQLAVLGFNLNKLARELARRAEVALVG
jgi:IS5 family transposase